MESWDSSEEDDSPTSIELWNEYIDNGRLELFLKSITPTSKTLTMFAHDFLSFCLTKVDLHYQTQFKLLVCPFSSAAWAGLPQLQNTRPDEYLDGSTNSWAGVNGMLTAVWWEEGTKVLPDSLMSPNRRYQELMSHGFPAPFAKMVSQYHGVILLNADKIRRDGKRFAELKAA